MIILSGVYSFKRKLVGYRNDFCLSCEAPRRAHEVRSLDVIHIFFVPVLPLGFLRHWRCSVCGSDPHFYPRTRKGFLWAGIVILAIFTAVVWLTPDSAAGDSVLAFWAMRIAYPIGLVFALRHTLKSKPDLRLPEKLREVMPAQESICPFCHGLFVLSPGDRWLCSQCGVERKVVRV